jgi:hypothetical protein
MKLEYYIKRLPGIFYRVLKLEKIHVVDINSLPTVTEANAAALIEIVQSGVRSKITVKNLTNEYIRKAEHSVIAVTTSQTINLSIAFSVNIIVVSNPGLTLTLQFPLVPVEGQICQFTTLTNTVTLVVGTAGSYSINPSFAGAPTAGFSATYVYHIEDTTWYEIA